MAKPSNKIHIPYDYASDLQKQMSEAIAGGAKVILAVCGIRGGKTYGALMEGLKQIYTYQREPALGWIISPTFPMSMVAERLWREKIARLPDGRSLIMREERGKRAFLMYPPPKLAKKIPYYRVEIKSADDPDHLRGFSVAWAILDEGAMMKPAVLDVVKGRVMDNDGIIIIATTPRGKNWVYHEVYLKSLTNPRYAVIRGRTADNKYLTPELVEELHNEYAAKGSKLAQQEMDGQFCDFEGLVFDQFRHGEHILSSRTEISDNTPVVCGIDFGYNDPFVCVWLGKIDGVWVVLDEYYKPHGLLKDHFAFIKGHRYAPQVKRYWADPSALQERKELLALGLQTMPARRPDKLAQKVKWDVARARLINNLFAGRMKSPWKLEGHVPALMFMDTVTHGVREISSLCYKNTLSMGEDPTTGAVRLTVVDATGSEVERNAKEEIIDKDNHFVDALGYALFSEIRTLGGNFKPHYSDDSSGKIVEQNIPTPEQRLEEELRGKFEYLDEQRKKKPGHFDPYDTLGGFVESSE